MRVLLCFLLTGLTLLVAGCKRAPEGGSGRGVIYSTGTGGDSTNATVSADGWIPGKDNTNGGYRETGSNGVPYSEKKGGASR